MSFGFTVQVMSKSDFLQIRVTPTEKRLVAKHSRDAELDMSTWVMQQLFPSSSKRFQTLVAALLHAQDDRLAFAELHDFFVKISDSEFSLAVKKAPEALLNSFKLGYLAAMVEYVAYRRGVPCPLWTAQVPCLTEPFFASGLHSLRFYLLISSPPPFRRRNIFIDSTVGERV